MPARILDWNTRLTGVRGSSGGVSALMVGAGVPAAFCGAPDWPRLVASIGNNLEPGRSEVTKDPRLRALELSWTHARRQIGPAGSRFQEAVVAALVSSGTGDHTSEVVTAIATLIRTLDVELILDLNYDTSFESILEESRLDYIRTIGSEGPLGDYAVGAETVLVWKVHGSLKHPGTIVLSPTEYQRVYETNEVGELLRRWGAGIEALWTVGVGLSDDDVWASLCAANYPRRITCLWCSDEDSPSSAWQDLVATKGRAVTVIRAPLTTVGICPLITRVCDHLNGSRPPKHRAGIRNTCHAKWQAFDRKYFEALETGVDSAVLATIDEFRSDYDAVCDYLLAHRQSGVGPRWYPSVSVDAANAADIAADTVSAIGRAMRLVEECVDVDAPPKFKGVLPAAAAQASIIAALETALLNGVSIQSDCTAEVNTIQLTPGRRFIVGTDPFLDGRREASWLRSVEMDRDVLFSFSRFTKHPPVDRDSLLTEDEWEAAAVERYASSDPRIIVGTGTVALSSELVTICPPPFSWGFLISELSTFRRRNPGTWLTRIWYLVNKYNGARQVCKGGGLNLRLGRQFLLGSRGHLKAGEYDDFVGWAQMDR